MNVSDAAAQYQAHGWKLVPIPAGTKGPTHTGWNLRENCTVPDGWQSNVGLAHAYSGTCALDLDDVAGATAWLSARGIGLRGFLDALDAVGIDSGRENSSKLLYQLEAPLPSVKVAEGSRTLFELRCATSSGLTVQDLLPPSVHPSGSQYQWKCGPLGHWTKLPSLPEPVRKLWESLLHRPAVASATVNGGLEAYRPPTGLTQDQARAVLRQLDPDDYDLWVRAGQALQHEYGDDGLDLWDEWSTGSPKYPGREELERKWSSFGRTSVAPLTIRYLLKQLKALKPKVEPATQVPIVLRHAADIVREQREPEWLILDEIEARVLAVLAGPRSTFKSFVATNWAMQAALAGHCALILSGEGAGLDRRMEAWRRTYAPGLDLESIPIYAYERAINLNLAEVVGALVAAIAELPQAPELIVIDTFSKYAAGLDENDNAEVAAFLARLASALRDALGCTVLLVAHSGHSDSGRPRGASSLMANPDAEYIVTRPDPTGPIVTVTRERFKDTPSLSPLCYRAVLVDLERVDKRGRPVTSLAMVPEALPVQAPPERLPKGANQRSALAVVREMVGDDIAGGGIEQDSLLAEIINRMVKPAAGRDTRPQRAQEALQGLIGGGFVVLDRGRVRLREGR